MMVRIPVAHAQFDPGAAQEVGLPGGLPDLILGVINTVLILAAVAALGFIVYGGFMYITARGDDQAVEAAKGSITNAVIGLVVIGVAAAIVNFVLFAIG